MPFPEKGGSCFWAGVRGDGLSHGGKGSIMDVLRRGYRRVAVIGLVMFLGIFLFAAAAEFVKRSFAPFSGFGSLPDPSIVRYILIAAAAADFFLISFFKKRFLGADPGRLQGDISRLVQRLTNHSIITFALSESIALYGLVLFLLTGNDTDLYLFLLAACFSFSYHFPRYRQWEEWVRNQMRTGIRQTGGQRHA